MIFQISRTSDWAGKKQPCKNAKILSTEDKQIIWQIEINTLDELMELIKEVEGIIVNDDNIEIYDNYRE